MTAAVKAPPAAPEREARCRVHSRAGNLCPNPALDPDPGSIQICSRHAAEVLEMIREQRNRNTRSS